MTIGQELHRLTAEQDFLKKVRATFNIKGHFVPCPAGCANGQFMVEHDCRGFGYAPGGCPLCNNLGFTATECPTCSGEGDIWVTEDDGLAVYHDAR